MQSRTVVPAKVALWSIGMVAFVAYAFSIAFLLRSMATKIPLTHEVVLQRQVAAPAVPVAVPAEQSIPLRLLIPSINVDASIDSVGIAANGAMDIKKDQDLVAWYNLGPKPGNTGSAVIAGHYGWVNGKGSVFNELHTLKAGDKVSVSNDKGVIITFVVRKTQSYDPAADATNVFHSDDGKAHLNLVTCEGVWDNNHQTYSSRLVVFTDKE